ncbi:Mitochondrial ATP-independent inner membrane protease subunit 1b-like protein [Drosera capensis]
MTFAVDPRSIGNDRKTVIVPKGHVWVQGDNVYESRDSCTFGAVPYALLQGRVFWRADTLLYSLADNPDMSSFFALPFFSILLKSVSSHLSSGFEISEIKMEWRES